MKQDDGRAPSVYEHASIESALKKKRGDRDKKGASNSAVLSGEPRQRATLSGAIARIARGYDRVSRSGALRPWTRSADQALDRAPRVDARLNGERQAACLQSREKNSARGLCRAGYPLFLERRRFRDGSSRIIPVTVLSSAVDKGGKSG